jgi:tripartite-type tricarboxylate transporter receptor subunit TctC
MSHSSTQPGPLIRAGWLCMLSLTLAPPSAAQEGYPSKPVHIIVPSTPGGGTDTVTRLLGQQLAKSMGQPFVIDNRPGAGNVIGAQAAARAAPDGYTLLMAPSTVAINHIVRKNLPYDVLRDFAPITQLVSLPNVLVVTASLPVHTVAEFITLVRQKPGELTFGSAGVGTAPHLAMELMMSAMNVRLRHVPYKGVAPALTDIIAGRVSCMTVNALSARRHVEAGTLRALVVTGTERMHDLPDVPTVAEAGYPKAQSFQWFGLLAPAGTPAPIIARLQSETAHALRTPEMRKRLATEGADPVGSTPAEFASLIRDEMDKWATVARAADIRPE